MFEKAAPVNFSPVIRCWTIAWELTSIKAYWHPASTILANNSFKANASGVVCVEGITVLLILFSTVDNKPTLYPKPLNKLNNKVTVVVFPFVPVIPISFNFSDGLS